MNELRRADTTTLAAEQPAAAATEDAWDRLAALAFDGGAAESGCSEHAHDCTCLAAHGAAEVVGVVAGGADAAAGDVFASSRPEAPLPDPERPVDPEAEPPFADPAEVPEPDRPVYPEPEPEPTPPLSPEPEEDDPETGI